MCVCSENVFINCELICSTWHNDSFNSCATIIYILYGLSSGLTPRLKLFGVSAIFSLSLWLGNFADFVMTSIENRIKINRSKQAHGHYGSNELLYFYISINELNIILINWPNKNITNSIGTTKEHNIDYQCYEWNWFIVRCIWMESSSKKNKWKMEYEIKIISSGSIRLLFIGNRFDLWKIAIL